MVGIGIATALISMPARAQVETMAGPWQQISSNAGPCPTCQLSIAGIGALSVTANNGWSASIVEQRRDGLPAAVGRGRWRVVNSAFDGKDFAVDLQLRGDRLYMTMRIALGKGALRVVRAVYGRPWLGS